MKNFESISLKEKNYYSAAKWGFLVLIYSFFVSIYLKSNLDNYPFRALDNFELNIVRLVYLSTWIVRIIVTIFVVKISKKLNRNFYFWGILGLAIPPFSLIIIGFLDYKISNTKIRNLVEKIRLDYKAELIFVKRTLDVSPEELSKINNEITKKYEQDIKTKISILLQNDGIDDDLNEELEPIKKSSDLLYEPDEIDLTVCPACGADIDNKMDSCSDCGISLK